MLPLEELINVAVNCPKVVFLEDMISDNFVPTQKHNLRINEISPKERKLNLHVGKQNINISYSCKI